MSQILTSQDLSRPLLPGSYDLFLCGMRHDVRVTSLLEKLDVHTLELVRKAPQHLPSGVCACVRIQCEEQLVLEEPSVCAALGRFVLRQQSRTVAVGIVLSTS
jgi:peptide chain release factor subunit 3